MKKGQSLVYFEQIQDETPSLNSIKILKFLECENDNKNSKRTLHAVTSRIR